MPGDYTIRRTLDTLMASGGCYCRRPFSRLGNNGGASFQAMGAEGCSSWTSTFHVDDQEAGVGCYQTSADKVIDVDVVYMLACAGHGRTYSSL